jgi:large subunit ribosomal protein L5
MCRYARCARDILYPDLVLKLPVSSMHQLPQLREMTLQTTDLAQGLALLQLTGAVPGVLRARHNVASFQLRRGQPLGWRVHLRGEAMYRLLELLVDSALPRHREFRGWTLCGGQAMLGLGQLPVLPRLQVSGTLSLRASSPTLCGLLWSGFRLPVITP